MIHHFALAALLLTHFFEVTAPANAYVEEDDSTFYVAEDGVTFYVQET